MWRRKLIDILIFLLQWDWSFRSYKPEAGLSPEIELGMWSQLWENGAFRKYILLREKDLLLKTATFFVAKKPNNAENVAGQLMELLIMRDKAVLAYERKSKERQRKAKEQEAQERSLLTNGSPQGNGDSAVSDELSGPRNEAPQRPERG